MQSTVQTIPLINLAIIFLPVLVVIGLLYKWSLEAGTALYSIFRMLLQLVILGYVLVFIFESQNLWMTLMVITIMVVASSWIALRTIQQFRQRLFSYVFVSSLIAGGSVLYISIHFVLALEPIYKPQYSIPIAGMVFANTMNTMSLALERIYSELKNNISYTQARNTAFHASLIPIINSMFAVGIVSLPGMMTGQVLSGISPLIAIRYQILIMCMIFSACALSTAMLLVLARKPLTQLSIR